MGHDALARATPAKADDAWLHRSIELWLPLATDANERYDWGYGGHDIERLIIIALPDLERIDSSDAARAVLWYCHRRQHHAGAGR
jgi:hypothetical protein